MYIKFSILSYLYINVYVKFSVQSYCINRLSFLYYFDHHQTNNKTIIGSPRVHICRNGCRTSEHLISMDEIIET